MKKTKRMFLTLALTMVFVAASYAQIGTAGIRGTVTDAYTAQPLAHVNVYATDSANSSLTYNAITDVDGTYEIYHMLDDKTYNVYLDNNGHVTYCQVFSPTYAPIYLSFQQIAYQDFGCY
jgi:Carboxypeptidase regulatory-like domain